MSNSADITKNELTAILSGIAGAVIIIVAIIAALSTSGNMSRYEYQAYSEYLETCKALDDTPVPPNQYQAYSEYLQTCRFNNEKPLSLNEFQKIEPLKDDKKLEFR